MRVGGNHLRAWSEDPHDNTVELDPDLDMPRGANRVDPIGPFDAAPDLARQIPVHEVEKWLRARNRQLLVWDEADGKVELIARNVAQAVELGGPPALHPLIGRSEHRDILGGRDREPAGYVLVMAVEKKVGQDR